MVLASGRLGTQHAPAGGVAVGGAVADHRPGAGIGAPQDDGIEDHYLVPRDIDIEPEEKECVKDGF